MQTKSLRRRLGLTLGILLSVLWVVAASVTALLARHAMEEVFDSALQETAQRIMPLAVADVLDREPTDQTQRLSVIRDHDELLTYVMRDQQGRILLLSHDADLGIFPLWEGTGFSQSTTHRFYSEDALQGSVRLTVAEPLAHRSVVARDIQMGLGLPLLIFLPLAILVIILAVRSSLVPLHRFRARLATRGVRDFSPVPVNDLPTEVAPVADTLNSLLQRLGSAFQAERSFAANAAHELRTPLAGAIAQAQRLQSETRDPAVKARAADIEMTLKRLTRLSERLMQLARAEGGRLRLEHASDMRPVAQILTEDLSRLVGQGRISLEIPTAPLMSDLDPDVFAIIYRNLVENALRHGAGDEPVHVSLSIDGLLSVSNAGPVVPKEVLCRLTDRFVRLDHGSDGSGLGLAIVNSVAERLGNKLSLQSPRPGDDSGFEASLLVPVTQGSSTCEKSTA
ncbi:ATP-binding protein [Zwartia sp.]|uniref:ATP-binding protein n=1 Tax=Zwartia sp. TaxID=2978004 RepID=UPI00271E2474|nr:ATP-binding protein [Zwartia sp.]MDO9024602.1 ATP-binding protein [Zwartia sp.]